jgi:hypothetical protein
MKKYFVVLGIVALLVCVGLSGCNQISNLFLSDEDKFVGLWGSEGFLDVPTVIGFSSNGTLSITVQMGLINFSSSGGGWELHEGILTMELEDLILLTTYTYEFEADNTKLTLTEIDSGDSYLLTKK